ncbi:helix-turn-helix domain-containing protein [Paenilisteria rocourtiae]|uniref:HTH cro/C1-type domain-containing protein n=1 Tax=Listeria rocourtiae TaxID=647910 RepID=A0A4R6ZR31_9LIST|nr:helix-turn-helix transcriptional regulator [Listeria rocourtiae]EUJ44419.1 hypothetical protein PROCOU_13988 [Listeria rocourtiae FSL F6-920]TDR55101.1 hypothetical protein DFP96_10127 [Listeria rocourtiae]
MHPISKLLIEYDTSLYALQKYHGMQQPSLSRSIKNEVSIEKMNVSTITQFARAFDETPETILRKLLDYEEEQKMENAIYVNKHNQGQSEIWNDEAEFRNYFLPYTNDNGELLSEDAETWELIETINRDSNLYEIAEEKE